MKTKSKNIFGRAYDFWDIYGGLIGLCTVLAVVLALIFFIVFPTPYKRKMNEKELYRNEKVVIVGTNEAAQDFSHDKFHRPIVIKVWLVQRVNDTTQFAEITSSWSEYNFYITKELWYSKGIGDTLYFDYILKRRFFTIKEKQYGTD